MESVGQQRFFAIVPVAVIYDHHLKPSDVRVYATLSERAGTKKRAWPGVRRIASDIGCSTTTVSEAVRRLEAAGHIEVDRQKGRSNTYWLPMTGVPETDTPAYQELAQGVPETDTELDPGTRRSSSSSFQEFHTARSIEEADRRKRAGYPVRSVKALAKTISNDPDFVKESHHAWKHRDCDACEGKGTTEVWAPGSGTVQVPCERKEP